MCADMAGDPLNLIETARQALWTCIDQYSELEDLNTETGRAFIREFKGDDSDDGLVLQRNLEPAIGEVPAIAIKFAGLKSLWDQNQSQKWEMKFAFWIWTIDWHQPRCTSLAEKVLRAFWRYNTLTPPSSSDNHIKMQTGYYPREYGLSPVEFVDLKDSGQVSRIEGFVNLRSTKNPFVD